MTGVTTARTWAGEARGKDVVVTCAGTAGFRKHPNEDPVADGKLRVATVAVRLGDAFFRGRSESSAGCFPIILRAMKECFKGLVEGVLNHLRTLDVGVENRLVSEVEVVGGKREAVTARLVDTSTVGRARTQFWCSARATRRTCLTFWFARSA